MKPSSHTNARESVSIEFDPKLMEDVYDELKLIAHRTLRNVHARQSLNATDLVHEAWIRMQDQRCFEELGRCSFLSLGAITIRRVLVDYVRNRRAQKRGGGAKREPLFDSIAIDNGKCIDLLALNDALVLLAKNHQREATAIELRFFGGLTHEEVAETLKVSVGTAKSDWRFAQAWLMTKLGTEDA